MHKAEASAGAFIFNGQRAQSRPCGGSGMTRAVHIRATGAFEHSEPDVRHINLGMLNARQELQHKVCRSCKLDAQVSVCCVGTVKT